DSAGAGESGVAGDGATDGGADGAGGSTGGGCVPECGYGLVCTPGSCPCPPQESTCSNTCVDLQTDAANCGTCGHTCTDKCGGGHCFRELVDLSAARNSATYLAADATYVYFTQTNAGTVSRVPRKGGSV